MEIALLGLRFGPGLSSTSPLNNKRRLQNHVANQVLIPATREGDTRELLLLLQLLSFNIKNTTRNRNKRTLLRKKQAQSEKTFTMRMN